eukprot:6744640-Prymnesium_polylepis.1
MGTAPSKAMSCWLPLAHSNPITYSAGWFLRRPATPKTHAPCPAHARRGGGGGGGELGLLGRS